MTDFLRWTGYPLVDVGASGIAAFAEKRGIVEVTIEDGRVVADYIERHYPHEPLKSFLASVFPNSGYVNPTMGEDKRRAFIQEFLHAFERPAGDGARPCAFCGRPSASLAFRQHIPLTMGEGVINFVPNGVAGLPVCGACLLCIQAVPLASVRCEGRLLIVHSNDQLLTMDFARAFQEQNTRQVTLASALPEKERKGAGRKYPRTLLLDQLRQVETATHPAAEETGTSSISAYHLTNYGTGPDIAIYHLPSEIVGFLRTMWSARYEQVWSPLVSTAWADAPGGGERRNRLYDAIFGLPAANGRFIRQFLLHRSALRDTARDEAAVTIDLVSWDVTQVFLRKVVGMERERIEAIRVVGDRIAHYIERENDRRLFQGLLGVHGYRYLRLRLIKASLDSVKTSGEPLITLDDFVTIFEQGEEIPRVDWALARDLVLIRAIEGLKGWLRKEPDVLQDALADVEAVGSKVEGENPRPTLEAEAS